MFAAVVMTGNGTTLREDATFSAFVEDDKHTAIMRGMRAIEAYQKQHPGYRTARYFVLVGELTERADIPIRYDLTPLKTQAPLEVVGLDADGDGYDR